MCARGILEQGRDGHEDLRRENDANVKDQSSRGGRGGKGEAAELEPAAELGFRAVVYTINNESITK